MNLSKKAEKLLVRIAQTEDESLKAVRSMAKAADELKNLGMAVFIPVSTGGFVIALTRKGRANAVDLSSH